MSTECLGPEAEGALRRASARRVQRHKGVEQERHIVAADIQVTPVDVGHMRQRVEILDRWPVRIMDGMAVLAVLNAENFFDRLSLRVFHDGGVGFLSAGCVTYLRL